MEEIWKDIKGYEGKYQVSNLGRVKSLKRYKRYGNTIKLYEDIILKQGKVYNYSIVNLCKNKTIKNFRVHRLVAQAFIPNPQNKQQVNHIDGNRQNNNVKNLEWCTSKENITHSYKKLNRQPNKPWLNKFGKENPNSKIVYQINKSTNDIISVFYGISEAYRKTGVNRASIYRVCNKKAKTAGGFIWRYKEEYDRDLNIE